MAGCDHPTSLVSRKETIMNKLIKGAIAGAAGVALLLGGAGTFALWNSAATVAGGVVASGTLTIANSGAASWKNVSADAVVGGVAIPAIASYRIVPGDRIELSQSVTIIATGNNLVADLSYDDATIVGTGVAGLALKSALLVSLDASGTGITRVGSTNVFTVAPSASATTAIVKVTIELPSTVTGTVGQSGSIDLSGVSLKLVQSRP